MTATESKLAVLFADIADSTRLYTLLGDTQALAAIGQCLDLARDCGARYGGRLVKTIGDEAMLIFSTADQAASAAADIQLRMSEREPVAGARLAFRIGFHAGLAIEQDGDVFGDCVNTAARMVAVAKGGQIVVSMDSATEMAPYLRRQLRELDVVTVKGKDRDVGIAELLWQDAADRTTLVSRPILRAAMLELRHGAQAIRLDAEKSLLTLGRDAQSDIVIADRLASRLHARIERRRNKFALIDQSTNGTYVTFDGEREFLLHREEVLLRGRGHIGFGHSRVVDSGETVTFACLDTAS
ncbi:MAG: adenylate/guanylate cyclase domain-containing protein [Burkholderiales bacterium]|nr:adenylate/guanylate cyclase domain-containing protein [Burkholderiales bacterium]